jgi:hypothetical protein
MQRLSLFLSVSVATALAACSETNDGAASTTTEDDPVTTPIDDDAGVDEDEDQEEDEDPGDDNPPTSCTQGGENDDVDGDGFTPAQGDCEDCSAEINPAAYDFPGDKWDEDCSGTPAEAAEDNCDQGLAMGSTAAEDAARAMGLCKFVSESDKGWGVLSARFTTPDGTGTLEDPMMVGLLPSFGNLAPRAGGSMLAISSGVARAPDQAGFTPECDFFKFSCGGIFPLPGCIDVGTPPEGYPKESSVCGDTSGGGIFDIGSGVNDQVALEVKIRVPSNANSYAFDSIFYTYEYPTYICSAFNDFFVVMSDPKPEGVADGNIVFDSNGDPIGVNTGLLAVCDPAVQLPSSPKQFDCEQGAALLSGTGFGPNESQCGDPVSAGGASTGWLHTTAPVKRSTVITLRFGIWDTQDETLDSTALVDKFEWSVDEPNVETTPVVL